MAAIALRCQTCSKDTDNEHSRRGVCLPCLARAAVAVELEEYKRLWAKRQRYARQGGRYNGEQLDKIARRIQAKLHGFISGEKANELFGELIHEARAFAGSAGGRIAIAQTGDFLRKEWPDGVRTLS